jgi:hypothetical protein
MASYRALGARDCNPMWTPNWFDPLGRDRRVRREESTAPVEVIEERTREGVRVVIITRNRT